jgi:hypothetical protein
MSGHFVRYGSCGHVVAQCRCLGPKTVERADYPCEACRMKQEQEEEHARLQAGT